MPVKNIEVIDCNKFFLLPSISRRIFYYISPKIFEPFLNNFIATVRLYFLTYIRDINPNVVTPIIPKIIPIGKSLIKELVVGLTPSANLR